MKTLKDLVIYLHRGCFSPMVSTWTKAIDAGYFTNLPGLISAIVRKHLPKAITTIKVHLRQDRQNVRSTKPSPTSATVTLSHVMSTSAIPLNANVQTHSLFAKTMSVAGRVFSNQTCRFMHTSSRGTKDIMVFYDYYSNAILPETINSHSEHNLTRAFAKLNQNLTNLRTQTSPANPGQ